MKNRIMLVLVMCLVLVMFGAVPVFADARIHNTAGVKADLPKLIGLPQISNDLFIGIEGSKQLATDLFYETYDLNSKDTAYVVWVKITYEGCILNCPKK